MFGGEGGGGSGGFRFDFAPAPASASASSPSSMNAETEGVVRRSEAEATHGRREDPPPDNPATTEAFVVDASAILSSLTATGAGVVPTFESLHLPRGSDAIRRVVLSSERRSRGCTDDNGDDDDPAATDDLGAEADLERRIEHLGTDLIPGSYGGGLKVWECSLDLCRFLAEVISDLDLDGNNDKHNDGRGGGGEEINLDGSNIKNRILITVRCALGPNGSALELGCGHGLPGCLLLREGILRSDSGGSSSTSSPPPPPVVTFADFNGFVIRSAAIPNAWINALFATAANEAEGGNNRSSSSSEGEGGTHESRLTQSRARIALLQRVKFVAGDWHKLSSVLSSPTTHSSSRCAGTGTTTQRGPRYDLVLASETTYSADACRDTALLMARHLKPYTDDTNGGGGGMGLVATKRFYFGVGGGADDFRRECSRLSSSFGSDEIDSGVDGLRMEVHTVRSYDTGGGNIRDLLAVTCHRRG